MSAVDWLTYFLAGAGSTQQAGSGSSTAASFNPEQMLGNIDPQYEMMEPWALGVSQTPQTQPRTRLDIYTTWAKMYRDPSISGALKLHVSAALGGHESRAECIFIVPSQKLRAGTGKRATQLAQIIEQEGRLIASMINPDAFTLMSSGVRWGDAYTRVYTEQGKGVVALLNSEYTSAPRIQAYERGGVTVGYHVLELDKSQRVITKLTTNQMVRLKMPRTVEVPQTEIVYGLLRQMLQEDSMQSLPIIPAPVGGSFLYEAEQAWSDMLLLLSALTSQQIADSVKQANLTVDMDGMPPEQRGACRKRLEEMLLASRAFIESALKGGKAVYGTQYSFFPTWGNKQIVSAMNDLGQRGGSQGNTEPLMIAVRRLFGSLGIDMSMVGWADMLSGGLGDGGFFHTSAQVSQRATMQRQGMTHYVNDLMQLHMQIKHGVRFDPNELPWEVQYFSTISASTTEAESNRQTRMGSLGMAIQSLAGIKDLGLSQQRIQKMLEDAGWDLEEAKQLAMDLAAAKEEGDDGQPAGAGGAADGDGEGDDDELA